MESNPPCYPNRELLEHMPPVKVATSTLALDHKPSQTEYQQLWRSFVNEELSPAVLLDRVLEGRSFSPWFGEPRGMDTWQSVQFVGVDLEKHRDAALEVACANRFYQLYGAFAYTTMSHQWDAPRSRLVFLLDQPVLDKESWHWGAKAVCEMWGIASDVAAADRGRSFLGSPGAMVHVNGKILKASTLLQLSHQREQSYNRALSLKKQQLQRRHSNEEQALYQSLDKGELLQRLCNKVSFAAEGTRNSTLNRVSFIAGKHIVTSGEIPEGVVTAALIDAALASGLAYEESSKTVAGAIQRGMHA